LEIIDNIIITSMENGSVEFIGHVHLVYMTLFR